MLELKDITVHYEKAKALGDVSLKVPERGIVALIGANGAGKSTILRTISAIKTPTTGEIWFQGKRIDGFPPVEIVRMGIVHVPEGRMLFSEMTVLENLYLGAYLEKDGREIKRFLEQVFTLFPILKQRKRQIAGSLSGGEQQMLALGRGLMAKPKLLLLDEPSLGLAPLIIREIMELLIEINQRGISVLLVEQNAYDALKLAHWGYVLETGNIVMDGEASKLLNDENVRKAYLGM
ncbi:MAG: ABC transporter ATP-binding protein [candidate division Zixibacteria bacterium]|nr:ABC transporter ATP-binding protein [candidate division Zixibacteria bacterium]